MDHDNSHQHLPEVVIMKLNVGITLMYTVHAGHNSNNPSLSVQVESYLFTTYDVIIPAVDPPHIR